MQPDPQKRDWPETDVRREAGTKLPLTIWGNFRNPETERYIPITQVRARLESKEVLDAAAAAIAQMQWDDEKRITPRATCSNAATVALEAALEAAGFSEGES